MARPYILAGVVLVLCGCAESTLIRTSPPGAKVTVNDRFVGVTPSEYSVSRSEFDGPLHYRIELPGYQPAEGELQKQIGPGRIVGGIFTVGISMIFKPPVELCDSYDFALQPALASHAGQAPASEAEVESHAGAPPGEPGADVRARLRQVKDLYDRGIITEQEYQRARAKVLNQL